MKTLSHLFILLFLSFCQIAKAQLPGDFKKIEVSRYSFKPTKEFKLLTIPTSFGNSQLANAAMLDSLKNKKVASVRLVYTKYRESETFDQQQLNNKRIANLIAINPVAFSDIGIKWYNVEQTMEDSIQAKNLFHGFYILYQNKPSKRDYAISDKLLNQNAIAVQTFRIRNHKDTLITGKEGTQVSIPSNCFLDENNKPYKGEVKMELKEAIRMESIILGNLVTMADGNALESGGMIYIDAKTKDGKTLTMKPGKAMGVNVPSKDVKPDMKLWEAENNGKFINWKNPVALNEGDNNLKINPKAKAENQWVSGIAVWQVLTGKYSHWSLWMTAYSDSGIFDVYTISGDNKMKVELYEQTDLNGPKVIADTIYNFEPFRDKKIALPIPSRGKKLKLGLVYLIGDKLDWSQRINGFVNNGFQFGNSNTEYKFNFSQIGSWANIDRLANDSRTKAVDFSASLQEAEDYKEISMYLIFKDKKMYIPGFKSKKRNGYGFSHGDFEIPRLPVGAKATVLCIAYKNDKPYYAMQNITIAERQEVKMNPIASSEETIKKVIADSF